MKNNDYYKQREVTWRYFSTCLFMLNERSGINNANVLAYVDNNNPIKMKNIKTKNRNKKIYRFIKNE